MDDKICIVATHPYFINHHFLSQLNDLAQQYSITLVCDQSAHSLRREVSDRVEVLDLPIGRKPSLMLDIATVLRLFFLFKRRQFRLVLSFSPKIGLLSTLASRFSKIDFHLHVFTGQVWANRRGIPRYFLRFCDRIIGNFASHLLADSASQARYLVENRICDEKKIDVLGSGSVGGVDLSRFRKDSEIRRDMRSALGFSEKTVIFLYLGRLTRDKGIDGLLHALNYLIQTGQDAHLLVVGPVEDSTISSCIDNIAVNGHVTRLAATPVPENYINAADVLCLVSQREGFGSVVVEAAVCGIPAVVSDVYGLRDAVIPDKTALVVDLDNHLQLCNAMELMCDHQLRCQFGDAARERAIGLFDSDRLVRLWSDYLGKVLTSQ